jgi:4-amino-4-deoxy-L-arabinose transferase-like glycosyltransferase
VAISKEDKKFLILIVILHLGFFLWQVFQSNFYLKDSYEYLKAAANLRSDHLLYCGDLTKPFNYDLFTRRPPVYPVFLAASQMVSSGLIFVLIVQNLLSIFGIYLVRRMLLDFGYSTKYDILFIILLLFTPSQFIYTNLIMSETLLQFLIILLVWFFIKYNKNEKFIDGVWYGIIVTLCVLTKPVFVYFIYLNVLYFIWLSYRKRTFKLLLLGLIPFIFLSAYQIRNYNNTGVFETSSIGRSTLVSYNVNLFLVKTEGVCAADSTISSIDSLSKLKNGYKEEVAYREEQTLSVIMKHPIRYALFHIKGMTGFFLDPGRFDLVNFFNFKNEKNSGLLYLINEKGIKGTIAFLMKDSPGRLIILLIVGFFNLLKAACFLLFIFSRKINKGVLWFIVFLIFYIALLTGPLGASRFMMPLLPLYMGCCLLFVSGIKVKTA